MISAQGTIIRMNGTALNDLGDVTPPALTRKTVERTRLADVDDVHHVGRRKFGELMFETALVSAAALIVAWRDGTQDAYEVVYTDGTIWAFAGIVTNIAPKLDDLLLVAVSVQPAEALELESSFLMSEVGMLLLEDGGGILL